MKTIWVIGGPGCGKGTQCDKMIEKYGFMHISSGDLLREEVASGSPRGAELQETMSKGLFVPTCWDRCRHLISFILSNCFVTFTSKIVPVPWDSALVKTTEIVLDLIKEKITKSQKENPSLKAVLIDGYPRELDQGIQFEKQVCPVDLILFFDVANETLIQRLVGRAAKAAVQRADDNEETIKKRIEIFNEKNGEIVDHYKDKVCRINAEGAVDEIFDDVCGKVDELLSS